MKSTTPKGPGMEESLRGYFLKNGYYVLRGVPFCYNGFDVTDVDLWLYDRPSAVVRHRVVVDIKNKKTPQAIERIFWAKGVQSTLGLDQAIVATTDKREDVSSFGRKHNVLVIDGQFLSRLTQNPALTDGRLSEEQFVALMDKSKLGPLASNWKSRLVSSKQRVLEGLSFDQINSWLNDAKYFAEQVLLVPTHREVAARLLYFTVSLIAVAIDYSGKDMAFLDAAQRREAVNSGLRYGDLGAEGANATLDVAAGLVEQFLPEMSGGAARIRHGFNLVSEGLPTEVLAEYFARPSVGSTILYTGRVLEAAAYNDAFLAPKDLGTEAKALLLVLLDYWSMDRVRFMESLASHPDAQQMPTNVSTAVADDAGPLFQA